MIWHDTAWYSTAVTADTAYSTAGTQAEHKPQFKLQGIYCKYLEENAVEYGKTYLPCYPKGVVTEKKKKKKEKLEENGPWYNSTLSLSILIVMYVWCRGDCFTAPAQPQGESDPHPALSVWVLPS